MKIGYKALIENAEKEIETLDQSAAAALLNDPGVVFVDLRDPRELTREGKIPGAFHAPRGMLEFWVDPDSPYHKDVFSSGKRLIFYCQSGWRSALATQTVQRMGLENVCHSIGHLPDPRQIA
jgi:rhodanese-related sulfurtransferase